uniref:class I mannose-6-phosphate isomerase n=1 Tax=Agathobacter sp. TaxID=2021311 RepID=UPI0040571846
MSGIKPTKLEVIKKEYIWGKEEWLLSCLHEDYENIPLLIKKITARDALSVQVHPNDVYARKNEGSNGKTEMWYVLDCEPGAFLYYGLKHQISMNEFLKRIQNGTITEVCKKVSVKKGDVFYIPAGLVHAIGKGITVLEVQQSSNITYRVYDYQREDEHHQKRDLHIKQAAEVAGFLPALQGHSPMGICKKEQGYDELLLVQCPFFLVWYYRIKSNLRFQNKINFSHVYVVKGEGCLYMKEDVLSLHTGESIYIPENIGEFEIKGKLELLVSEVPR